VSGTRFLIGREFKQWVLSLIYRYATDGATLSHRSIAYIVKCRYSSLESALVQNFDYGRWETRDV
jgi:hypothetical protein